MLRLSIPHRVRELLLAHAGIANSMLRFPARSADNCEFASCATDALNVYGLGPNKTSESASICGSTDLDLRPARALTKLGSRSGVLRRGSWEALLSARRAKGKSSHEEHLIVHQALSDGKGGGSQNWGPFGGRHKWGLGFGKTENPKSEAKGGTNWSHGCHLRSTCSFAHVHDGNPKYFDRSGFYQDLELQRVTESISRERGIGSWVTRL